MTYGYTQRTMTEKYLLVIVRQPDGQYFVSYYHPEWEENKSLDILD